MEHSLTEFLHLLASKTDLMTSWEKNKAEIKVSIRGKKDRRKGDLIKAMCVRFLEGQSHIALERQTDQQME